MDKDKELLCLKKELKCWESMFARKYDRKPVKEDIDSSSPEIRDSYKRYAFLKTGSSGKVSKETVKPKENSTELPDDDGVFSRSLNKKPKTPPEKVCHLKNNPALQWRPKLKPLKRDLIMEEPLCEENQIIELEDSTISIQIPNCEETPIPRKKIGVLRKNRRSMGGFSNISQDLLEECKESINKGKMKDDRLSNKLDLIGELESKLENVEQNSSTSFESMDCNGCGHVSKSPLLSEAGAISNKCINTVPSDDNVSAENSTEYTALDGSSILNGFKDDIRDADLSSKIQNPITSPSIANNKTNNELHVGKKGCIKNVPPILRATANNVKCSSHEGIGGDNGPGNLSADELCQNSSILPHSTEPCGKSMSLMNRNNEIEMKNYAKETLPTRCIEKNKENLNEFEGQNTVNKRKKKRKLSDTESDGAEENVASEKSATKRKNKSRKGNASNEEGGETLKEKRSKVESSEKVENSKKVKLSVASAKSNKLVTNNFVKINLKKKVFVRGAKKLTGSGYKRKLWKKKTSFERPTKGVSKTGKSICYKCGGEGHWAKFCKGPKKKEDPFRKLDEEKDSNEAQHLNERRGSCFEYLNQETATLNNKGDYVGKSSTSKTFSMEDVMDINPCWPRIPYSSENQEADTATLFESENKKPTEETYGKVLKSLKAFGFTSFRHGQHEAISRIVSGLSTLLILSTGSGKSLCYQLPAYMYYKERKCITLVVSPLVALMQDQVAGLPSCLPGACLNSNMTKLQRQRVLKKLKEGHIAVLLVSPESLVSGGFGMGMLPPKSGLPPIAFACIDEAHCLSEWSHNFRPSYLKVCKVLRERYNIKCLLGLTATASQATAKSVIHHLGISSENSIIRDPQPIPNNLYITASRDADKDRGLVELLQMKPYEDCDSIIVYVTRRTDTERLAEKLRSCLPDRVKVKEEEDSVKVKKKVKLIGRARKSKKPFWWNVECYHAGLTPGQRKLVQNQFMGGELRIVVATVAFGMGLDKSDVRSVIHYNMPRSFENYVQEIGRAGRDGEPSFCHVFLSEESADLNEIRRHIYGNSIDRSTVGKFVDLIFPPCACKELNKKNLTLVGDENKENLLKELAARPLDTYSGSKTHDFYDQCDNDDTRQSMSDGEMELLFSQEFDVDVLKECEENVASMENSPRVEKVKRNSDAEIPFDEPHNEHHDSQISHEMKVCFEESHLKNHLIDEPIAHETQMINSKENSCNKSDIENESTFDTKLHSNNINYCSGHRKCLPIDDMIATLDMPQENIATLMAYLELHDKRWLENLNPMRGVCTIKCYGGPEQFQLLAKKFPPVALAVKQLRGKEMDGFQERRQIDLNVADVADIMCWDVLTVASEIRALQWNMAVALDGPLNTTGKSGIIVEFGEVCFHLITAEGVDDNERDTICDFLYKSVLNQEENRLLQLDALYNVLRGLSCEHYWQIDPDTRVDTKARECISRYFSSDEVGQKVILKDMCKENVEEEIPERLWNAVSRDIQILLASHPNEDFSGRAISRIFHGIESPTYPAIVFGRDRRFWRQYLHIDFNKLRMFVCKEMLRFK